MKSPLSVKKIHEYFTWSLCSSIVFDCSMTLFDDSFTQQRVGEVVIINNIACLSLKLGTELVFLHCKSP